MKKAHASFLLAEDFFSLLTFFHVLYFQGRPGGGKTHLAVLLAAWLQSRGLVNKTVSNFPCSFAVQVKAPLTDAAIILDETWMFINNRKAVFEYGGFVRKVNSYLLMPSVYPPHRLLTRFRVARYLNLFAYGLPAWLYRWDLNMESSKEHGLFMVVHPERAFGSYDTKYIPGDDGGIVEAIAVTTGQDSRYVDQVDENDEIADALDDVAEEVGEGVRRIEREAAAFKRARSKLR
jgi:hypothetical protein